MTVAAVIGFDPAVVAASVAGFDPAVDAAAVVGFDPAVDVVAAETSRLLRELWLPIP